MSNKIIKPQKQTKKNGNWKWGIGGIAVFVLVVLGVLVGVSVSGNTQQTQELTYAINDAGELAIPVSDITEEFQYIDYGAAHDLLLMRDSEGHFHTAFNTCEECFSRGNARFTYRNGILTCQSCGNQFNVSSIGTASWGGCQPVAIPEDYREDTETELIFPAQLLTYSEDMFQSWENNDFSVTLEGY